MSEIKLNAEQKLFVENKSGNMLVSASAGSGKTTTMILKLIDLIVNQKVPVQNLLVVTFTEAAAQEMKQKLYFELINYIKANSLDDETLKRLYAELDNIMVADIGTVHSVCKKIVTKYFYAVMVEPNFKIVSGVEYDSMFNTAINNVFNDYVTSGNPEFYNIFESFNEKRNFLKLKNMISNFYNFLGEQSNPDGWFYRVCDEITNTDLNNNKCAVFLFNYYKANLSGYIDDFKDLLVQANSISQKQSEIVNSYLIVAQQINKTKNFVELNKFLNTDMNFLKLIAVKDPSAFDYYEKLKYTTKAFKDCILKAKENFVTSDNEKIKRDCLSLREIYLQLFEITKKVGAEFVRLKQNAGVLDFADLQKLTLQILEDEKIKEELKQNYKYIFVDEYQDINQIQEDIILSLTNGKNLYMIGDIKQSIYAFRQCKPEIFLNKYNLYNLDGVNNKLLKLNENYRSNKSIINFANMIFNNIITNKTIGINYKNDAQLKCCVNEEGQVKLNIVNTEKVGDDEQEFDKDYVEAQTVLTEINNLIGKPFYNSKTKHMQNVTYNDIAILTRDSKGFVIKLYKLLTDHKVPVCANFKQSIFNSSEVSILYSLLKLIANSTCEVELATVLHSVMFNVSNNELAQIKIEGQYDTFYDNVINYNKFGKNKQLSDKIELLKNELETIRYQLAYKTISEIMDYIIEKYDLKNYYYALPDGQDRLTNIQVFCELLKNETFNYNLNRCLEFLESLVKKDDFLISSVASENSVKILTMHKSKGLEYPCVILCNMGKSFNTSVYRSDLVLSEEMGIGVNFKDTNERVEYNTIQKKAGILFNISNELNEQIRLLYVAITRARNFLTIVGTYDLSKYVFNKNRGVKSATNFLDLIFKGFRNIYNNQFCMSENEFDIIENNEKVCTVKLTNPNLLNETFENVDVSVDESLYDNKISNQILNNINAQKFKNSKLIATKNSVSGIMEEEDYVNISETNLSVEIIGKNETPESLKLGTAYHKIMQNINYREPLNVEKIIENLVLTQNLEEDIAKKIDKLKIEKAYNKIKELIKPNTKILCEQQFLLNTTYDKIYGNEKNIPLLIQGVIDLVLITDNNAVIIDFKTNKTKNVDDLIKKYSLQLQCYALAVSEGLSTNVEKKMLYLFNQNKFIEI